MPRRHGLPLKPVVCVVPKEKQSRGGAARRHGLPLKPVVCVVPGGKQSRGGAARRHGLPLRAVSFRGEHCETTAAGALLKPLGFRLSEPLLFGLGEGLGFICWRQRGMALPFLGGRIRPDHLTRNLCRNLGLTLAVRETSSPGQAWRHAEQALAAGQPVGLKLDCYYLDYFTSNIHFAAHYVALYGYDAATAFLIDTARQGGAVRTALASLAQARAARGPMSSRHLSYTIAGSPAGVDLRDAVRRAIRRNAQDFLNPPIRNFGWRGIAHAGGQIALWRRSCRCPAADLALMAALMERAGTGGALFRNLYRDFLGAACALTGSDAIGAAHAAFAIAARQWTEVAACIARAGKTGSDRPLVEAGAILGDLAERERQAMELLRRG